MAESKDDLIAAANDDSAEDGNGFPTAEDHCRDFVRMWGEVVRRQVVRVRGIRERFRLDNWKYEHLEDWALTEHDLEKNFRTLWAEEHMLIWAAYQLEHWDHRLFKERTKRRAAGGSEEAGQGERVPVHDEVLANVRNALEHLDEADFKDGAAVPSTTKKGKQSLKLLTGSRLDISSGRDLAFGLIDPEELLSRAGKLVDAVELEMYGDPAEQYAQMMADEQRGR